MAAKKTTLLGKEKHTYTHKNHNKRKTFITIPAFI